MEKAYFKMYLFLCWGRDGGNSSSGESKWRLPWGLLCETSGRRKLCMIPCHSCYIYRIWRSKEVGGSHNLGWQCKVQGGGGGGGVGGGKFFGDGSFQHVILLYWNFIVRLAGYCKVFYRIPPLFPILLLFYLFCTYLSKFARLKVQFKVS